MRDRRLLTGALASLPTNPSAGVTPARMPALHSRYWRSRKNRFETSGVNGNGLRPPGTGAQFTKSVLSSRSHTLLNHQSTG